MSAMHDDFKDDFQAILQQVSHLVKEGFKEFDRHEDLTDASYQWDFIGQGLNRDLGFSAADRVENIRRLAELVERDSAKMSIKESVRYLWIVQEKGDE